MDKDLLKHIGESTAYSAKGHFKTADIRRIATYVYITLNFALSIVCLANVVSNHWLQIFSIISLFASILLLISETHGGLAVCREHTKYANLYLELHNDTYAEFLNPYTTQQNLEELKERFNSLNKKERPHINIGGKYWAKYAIEKMKEMNIWWK